MNNVFNIFFFLLCLHYEIGPQYVWWRDGAACLCWVIGAYSAPATKQQLMWLIQQFVRSSVVGMDTVCWNLMRQVAGGDVSKNNLWLADILVSTTRKKNREIFPSALVLALSRGQQINWNFKNKTECHSNFMEKLLVISRWLQALRCGGYRPQAPGL